MITFIFICMFFLHVVDDYYLQRILSDLKQKDWWTKQPNYGIQYRYDYIIGLIMHSFSWAFMIMLPIFYYYNFQMSIGLVITLIMNTIIHGIVDDLKANKKKINLIMDQSIHMIQIIITALIWLL